MADNTFMRSWGAPGDSAENGQSGGNDWVTGDGQGLTFRLTLTATASSDKRSNTNNRDDVTRNKRDTQLMALISKIVNQRNKCKIIQ